MKLLYCQECGDIIAPFPMPRHPRFCRCALHAVWWEDPKRGILRLHEVGARWRPKNPDYHGGPDAQPGWQRKQTEHRAYVLGLHNQFLGYPSGHSKESIRGIIEATPSSYIFRTQESVIIRIRPGESNDTDWAEELPAA
jgi:hypothetical protein